MSDWPGVIIEFQLAHPKSVHDPLVTLAFDQIRDIYTNVPMHTKAKTGPLNHLRPLILRLRRVSGTVTNMHQCLVTLKLRKRRENNGGPRDPLRAP